VKLDQPLAVKESTMRICLVNEDRFGMKALEKHLVKVSSNQPECFSSQSELFARLNKVAFHIVLIGSKLNDVTMSQCVERVRATSGYKQVPIMILADGENRGERLRMIESGANEVLQTPVDIEELWLRIKNLVNFRSTEVPLMLRSNILEEMIARTTRKLAEREEELVLRLSRAIESRDESTGHHIGRVAKNIQGSIRNSVYEA
jgi:putative two-component system response regulator